MPEAEVFKLIINGGCFGLLSIIVIHNLYYSGPQMRAALDKLGEKLESTVTVIEDKHAEMSIARDKECRDERRELVAMFNTEREKDRQARHDQAQRCQTR